MLFICKAAGGGYAPEICGHALLSKDDTHVVGIHRVLGEALMRLCPPSLSINPEQISDSIRLTASVSTIATPCLRETEFTLCAPISVLLQLCQFYMSSLFGGIRGHPWKRNREKRHGKRRDRGQWWKKMTLSIWVTSSWQDAQSWLQTQLGLITTPFSITETINNLVWACIIITAGD